MKLLYLWIKNYKGRIINQEFNVSNSYQVSFDSGNNTLCILKNKNYINEFYGKNILDVTAIVGQNGSGKTTLTRCLYDLCKGVHPVSEGLPDYIANHIVIYETTNPDELIIYYYLSSELEIKSVIGFNIILVNSKGLSGETFQQAMQQHDMTTIYFTNSFEVNHVMPNQGLMEFSEGLKHKSLSISPMISLNRAFSTLKNHYGAGYKNGIQMLDVINRYAEKMCTDFKITYATATSYNFLVALRHCPGAIVKILPVMGDFELNITEFGEYIQFQKKYLNLSQFDQTVYFIRKNIYEHIAGKFKRNHWEQIYVNILCEIALFLNLFNGDYINVDFSVLEQAYTQVNSDEAFEIMLNQISDSEDNLEKKSLITKIRNIDKLDLDILSDLVGMTGGSIKILSSSMWFQQVSNFLRTYKDIQNTQISQTINFGYSGLIDLILDNYDDDKTVYGRMLNVIPSPMSSGEVALINIFSTVYTAMKMHTSGSLLLIIDEIDAFLHPKWQQEILTHITRWINESDEFKDKKVQLIIATHSPIILSDIPADKIIYIENLCKVKNTTNLTFGANINTLFYDSFFMDSGSIGEIAKKKIQEAMNVLNNSEADQNELNMAIYIIDNIGERFIREKLKSNPRYIAETSRK